MIQPKDPYAFDPTKPYGYMLTMDLHKCDVSKFNRKDLTQFFEQLCDLTEMELAEIFFWDDLDTPEDEKQTEAHTIGTSAVCFILTSNITVHTLDVLERVYIDLFTCKPFDPEIAKAFIVEWFDSKDVKQATFLERL
jgi:S-adenosylmethionine/arginine decarboxylase-like enzyme